MTDDSLLLSSPVTSLTCHFLHLNADKLIWQSSHRVIKTHQKCSKASDQENILWCQFLYHLWTYSTCQHRSVMLALSEWYTLRKLKLKKGNEELLHPPGIIRQCGSHHLGRCSGANERCYTFALAGKQHPGMHPCSYQDDLLPLLSGYACRKTL